MAVHGRVKMASHSDASGFDDNHCDPRCVVSVLSSRGLASLILRYQASAAGNRASSVRQFVTGVEMDTSIVVVALNASMNIFFFAVVAGSILLACILPSYAVLKLKPREILSKK